MANFALVLPNGIVDNIIVLNGDSQYSPGLFLLIPVGPDCEIGGKWDGQVFHPAPLSDSPPLVGGNMFDLLLARLLIHEVLTQDDVDDIKGV